ncbi:hypothetical protein [Aestuariivita sp.]|jgi:hypothetical protein|uniref:hypothetical protein n=1 Tax=Aestuariivita sp. TaxID=1872407 RepID=UPI002170F566|nr:hypothetical protein [Aestuariivita sp.]MCE8008698.1 hypothetical protein [Aestuariivita sp.]
MAVFFEAMLWALLSVGGALALTGYLKLRRTAARIRATRPVLELPEKDMPG